MQQQIFTRLRGMNALGRPVVALLGVLFLLATLPLFAATWRDLRRCALVPNKYNDGDSFHATWHGREYIFRLYYVDTPESDLSLEERVKEQAEYWDVAPGDIPALAKAATTFTEKFLEDGFTVYTQYDTARGRSKLKRYYAMIRVDDVYLSEALVGAGLARIYGNWSPMLPDGTTDNKYKARLRAAEHKAKRDGLGAWARKNRKGAVNAPKVVNADVVLDRPAVLYSLDTPPQALGTLSKGTTVFVADSDTPTMIRVRYEHEGRTIEGQCKRRALAAVLP
ncbi:MAG: thermonuclease family protein [Kiritimatiellae bacterium]|nr:thermonuclease family protein [Kiritimatiellia bacterium]